MSPHVWKEVTPYLKKKKKTPTKIQYYKGVHYKFCNKDENIEEATGKWKKQTYFLHVFNLRCLWVIHVKMANKQIKIW